MSISDQVTSIVAAVIQIRCVLDTFFGSRYINSWLFLIALCVSARFVKRGPLKTVLTTDDNTVWQVAAPNRNYLKMLRAKGEFLFIMQGF